MYYYPAILQHGWPKHCASSTPYSQRFQRLCDVEARFTVINRSLIGWLRLRTSHISGKPKSSLWHSDPHLCRRLKVSLCTAETRCSVTVSKGHQSHCVWIMGTVSRTREQLVGLSLCKLSLLTPFIDSFLTFCFCFFSKSYICIWTFKLNKDKKSFKHWGYLLTVLIVWQ